MATYTLQQAIDAKNELIAKKLLTEAEVFYATEMDVEIGYILGEPLKKVNSSHDEVVSIYQLYIDLNNKYEIDFYPCDKCDLQDACEDFGCAILQGIRTTIK